MESAVKKWICAKSVLGYAQQHKEGFFVGNNNALKQLSEFLLDIRDRVVLKCGSSQLRDYHLDSPALIDVGAGVYDKPGTPDDSDALLFLRVFQGRAIIHAFEAITSSADSLVGEPGRRMLPVSSTGSFNVHNVAVGSSSGGNITIIYHAHLKNQAMVLRTDESALKTQDSQVKLSIPLVALDDFNKGGSLIS